MKEHGGFSLGEKAGLRSNLKTTDQVSPRRLGAEAARQTDFLSSSSVTETAVQAGRALSVKYKIKTLFGVFYSLVLVPNLLK